MTRLASDWGREWRKWERERRKGRGRGGRCPSACQLLESFQEPLGPHFSQSHSLQDLHCQELDVLKSNEVFKQLILDFLWDLFVSEQCYQPNITAAIVNCSLLH